MRKLIIATLLGMAGVLVALGVGCHADENDPAGQAKELSDPVRRENAITNLTRLYTNALSKNNGNRAHADVKAIADTRSEERRVGKECRSRWTAYEEKTKERGKQVKECKGSTERRE